MLRTGTFGKVVLAQDTETGEYSALKILSLYDIIRMKQVDHVKSEKNILKAIKHPFIVSLKWYSKDEYNIYFLMDFACGGELFSYLRKAGKFPVSTGSFYAAEIVSALEYLHFKNIAHRDLKPENLLLDKEGHLKITDFGFAKRLKEKTWTLCGTPEYLAPEVIMAKGYGKAVDWWAFGVLVYEMLTGSSPYYGDSKFSTYEKILSGKIEWPKPMDSVAKDLIKKLLAQDRAKRLGCGKNGADEIKRHKFFREYDWSEVNQRKLTPPIIPKVYFEGDTRNFDSYPDTWRIQTVTEDELEQFDDF
ncbi:Protein kinase DC2 [Orchesella cincta]|uniref:Protein kinase DC2 n=1 Tax=Orchesella cincta TaxID=48709 RepID=A0A1D2MWU8_ORCCI|nr:Protein kinase DC2 [Orchesella cincta]